MSARPDLTALASRLACPPVTRFAPSPTGYLHLGHVVNAIYVWGVARAIGGTVLLRIEDHDRIRSGPQFEAAVLDDLDWLGFVADIGRHPPLRQSDRPFIHTRALGRLRAAHHVYACQCSRKDIGTARYPGTCRMRGLEDTRGRALRVQIAPGDELFVDGLLGAQRQSPADDFGDPLIRDRDAHWTYQFAVTADDDHDGVTLVIRGSDLLPSTGLQIRFAGMLGRSAPPVFLHHPLLFDPTGRKLSKSSGDTGVRELRAAGLTAGEVIGHAAAAVALLTQPRTVSASSVHQLFLPRSLD